jgi:hypothetical protein
MCLELSIMVLVGVFDKASESVLHLSPSLALPFPRLSFMNEHRGHLHFQFNLQCWVGTARLCVRYSGILLIRQNSILITHVTIKRCHFLRACLELEQPRGQRFSSELEHQHNTAQPRNTHGTALHNQTRKK